MNLDKFISKFELKIPDNKIRNYCNDSELDYIFSKFSEIEIYNGLFRFYGKEKSEKWINIVDNTFKDVPKNIIIFGNDWLGRVYGKIKSQNEIFMFDISSSEFYKLEITIEEFLNIDFVDYTYETFQINLFDEWSRSNRKLNLNEIVGYKIPLFLGGKDDISNFDIIDLEVDWEINKQLLNKIKL